MFKGLELFGLFLTSLLSYIVPKRKNYWIFTSLLHDGEFEGDPKYLFQYSLEHPEDLPENIEIVYVTGNKETEKRIQKLGFPVRHNKVFWTLSFLRAELIIVDGIKYGLGMGQFKYVQLWHGAGYKNIVLLNKENVSGRVKTFLLNQFLNKIVFITATSELEKERRQMAFNNRHVKVTGSPRIDAFKEQEKKAPSEKEIILYAPTFREGTGNINLFTPEDWKTLNTIMEQRESMFYIKRHPRDHALQVPKNFPSIKDVTEGTDDVQELLLQSTVLITDYSSIATDFVCLNRPILFFIYDYEEYLKSSRTFYYDLKKVLPGPFVTNFEQLSKLLIDYSWFQEVDYQKDYAEFKQSFHFFNDCGSSSRILKEIPHYI